MDKYARAQERIADGFWSVDAEAGRIYGRGARRLGSVMSSGYVFLVMSPAPGSNGNQNCYAHRVIWESVHGPISDGLYVNHINGIKTDNRLANLEVVTQSENIQHAFRTGLNAGRKGEAHHNAKITTGVVGRIRARAAIGDRQCDIATDLGLSRQHVNRIVRGKNWAA